MASRYVGPVGHRVTLLEKMGHDLTKYRPVRTPCGFCGVRSDIGCKHREADNDE